MPEAYSFLTAEDILSPSRDEAIGSARSQITALQNEQMLEFLNWLNGEFIFAAHGRHHAGGWSWMKKTSNFSIYQNSTLSSGIAAGAATFTLASATNWDNTGRSVIETVRGAMDFVDHSAKSSNTLTVSSASDAETVSIAHASGSRVHKLYAVPPGFGRVHQLWVNQVPYEEGKFSAMFPCGRRFCLYGQFLLLPRGSSTADGTLLYEQAPDTIDELEDPTNIPRRFKRWAVEMTLFHLYRIRRKRGDLETTLQLAERALETALLYDSVQSSSTQIRLA